MSFAKSKLFGLPVKVEEVPEYKGVFVRVVSGADRFTLEKVYVDIATNGKNAMVETALLVTCDGDGTRCFDDSDREAIANMPSDALQAILDAGLIINKMKAADVADEAKPLDETQI